MTILNVTGDLSGTLDTGIGSPTPQPLAIILDAVTYPKMQLETPQTLLGNPNGIIQNPQEIPIGPGLEFINGILNVVGLAYTITPSISSNQNDWSPTGLGTSSTIRLDASSYCGITGISGGFEGRLLVLENNGSMPVKLLDQDSNSLAINQFKFNRPVFLAPQDCTTLIYDGGENSWRLLSKEKNTDSEYFGSGIDGNINLSSGSITLSRDMYYRNLTLSGGIIYTNGWKIFVSEMLDISSAASNSIMFDTQQKLNGQVTQIIPTSIGTFTVILWPQGHTVASGSPGLPGGTKNHHTSGGNGGFGGNTPGTALFPVPVYRFGDGVFLEILGGAGGAQSTGGLSGAGGGVIFVSARFINRGANANTSIIKSQGGNGVNGGGGGWIFLCYDYLLGSGIANALDASGGNGSGSGLGGHGGRITVVDLYKDAASEIVGSSNIGTTAGGCFKNL